MRKISDPFLIYASNILADTDNGLSGGKIVSFFNQKSVQYNVDIPHSKIPFDKKLPNKRSAFLQNLEKFSPEQQFQIIDELTKHNWLSNNERVIELKAKLHEDYGHLNKSSIVNSPLIKETKHWLEKYPDAYKQYIGALHKYEKKIYERNLLDDLRLSLELLLRHILNNNKSLENQLSDLGNHQKSKGMSIEVTNMFNKLLDYYNKYQNNNVKHNDNVNSKEIELIIDLTSTFMKYLII
jgi:hypothetical protein